MYHKILNISNEGDATYELSVRLDFNTKFLKFLEDFRFLDICN